ncbi:MAG TPA: cache domain-containing protein [Ktedonobacteraceae bacterium]|jgi:methyl-accepting chemotaxis protein|nr:cache domain-containing protein [Ktedonobacteraceae bacterium]
MAQTYAPPAFKKRRFSLSVYIPLLLAITAIVPLLVTIGSIEVVLRPALVAQISSDMERDTQTRMQLVDTYLSERLNDIKTLSQSTAIKSLLINRAEDTTAVRNILITTQHRDVANYISLSLLDLQSHTILSYPAPPLQHGKYLIVPEALQQLQQSDNIFISNVFYNLTGNNPSVDLYARITDASFHVTGYVRASLGLRRIWEPVDSEPQTNGSGSYATILDQNGVRIAYTNPDLSGFTHSPFLFKAIAPLEPKIQQQIQNENLYGNDTNVVNTQADPQLMNFAQDHQANNITQFTPAGQQQAFEVARFGSSVVPWTYVLFKPLNDVTGLADQQLIGIFVIVTLVLILAVVAGLVIGRNLALPILRSVTLLRTSNVALKTLADEEAVIATEQTWMVEASEVALKSVQYYTNATSLAARRINNLSSELAQNIQYLDKSKLQKSLQEVMEAASYIERSIKHQETMNEKLATSLRVTTQATEQLTRGASSTNDAAAQMEYIVEQLTSVVGE